ncbi:carboxypeptidase-like regulatory domain-containing protein [Nonlabens ponticola]|uniref:Carboxypeptidase-like regulatory domain-containing protein n=1 Tax=Nonlabens ponticola TaxID=2496866 RepID=A0A3S9MVK0_9FLAO|nr:carboxypeptidase-like regulatory domain-containing protein [Nonlabens ponticola]AZQ43241.1 hypothetical protein EJ995_02945 [Nonlabens ponticola]
MANRFWLFFSYALIANILSAQIIVRGKVIDQGKEPILGVKVTEVGYQNVVDTDYYGNFKIEIQEFGNELKFEFSGYKSQTFIINNNDTNLIIELNTFSSNEYLDGRRISGSLVSGVLHNPIGAEVSITSPYIKLNSLLQLDLRYQTNFNQNQITYFKFGIRHIRIQNNYDIDFAASLMNVQRNTKEDFKIVGLESISQFGDHKAIIGLQKYSTASFISVGPQVGYATYIYGGISADVSSSVTFFNGFNSYDVQFRKSFEKFNLFFNYQNVSSFNEISIGIGSGLFY